MRKPDRPARNHAMPVTVMCPRCAKKMRAPQQARGRLVRCTGCDEPFAVTPRPWFYQIQGQEKGPVCPAVLLALAGQGKVGPDTLVRKGEVGRWVPAARISGLFRGNRKQSTIVSAGPNNTAAQLTPRAGVA